MKYILVSLAAAVLFCSTSLTISAQPKSYSVKNAHSHNDYVNPIPFYKAFNRGFGSIEADVYPVNGELLVAHGKKEIVAGNTLKKLYLDPLATELKKNPKRSLTLLIDIKENPPETLTILLELLKPFQNYLSTPSRKRNLSIVMSGRKPLTSQYADYPDYIQFDSDLTVSHTAEEWKRVGMVSLNFTRFSKWKGDGKLPEADEVRLKKVIDSVHTAGKRLRFWAAPDNVGTWRKFMNMGVDLIGTDKIDELADFLEGKGNLPQSTIKSKAGVRYTSYVNPFKGSNSADKNIWPAVFSRSYTVL